MTLTTLAKLLGRRGISFIDSTKLAVSHNHRIWGHKVFADIAQRAQSSVYWFYGFKLHLVVYDCGELLSVTITAGTVDDRAVVPDLVKDLFGKLFGDKGYVSQSLLEQLFSDGGQLITQLKKGMRGRVISQFDKLSLRKRGISETVNNQRKNISQIEHTRHRSVYNFFVNLMAGLVSRKETVTPFAPLPLAPSGFVASYIERTLYRLPTTNLRPPLPRLGGSYTIIFAGGEQYACHLTAGCEQVSRGKEI